MYEKSWRLKFYVQQLASLILTNNYILTRWFLSPPLGELCALGRATEGVFPQLRSPVSFALCLGHVGKDLKNRAHLLQMTSHSSSLSKA